MIIKWCGIRRAIGAVSTAGLLLSMSGCTVGGNAPTFVANLQQFVVDFARNALAAYLL